VKGKCTFRAVSGLNYAPHHGGMLGMEVQLHSFLTSAIFGEEWSASRSGHFTSGAKLSIIH